MEIKKIVIGRIGAPHGVRGEVRIAPLTDFPDRFNNLKAAYVDGGGKLEVETIRYNNQAVIAKFKGIDSRDKADALKNRLLRVDRSEVPPLNDGEYYSFDIIGLNVFDENGKSLGRIKQILKTGSNDVYAAENADGEQTLIPALKKVVTDINLAAGTMTVKLQEEFN
jgi:16S rRNA processing protein RimM